MLGNSIVATRTVILPVLLSSDAFDHMSHILPCLQKPVFGTIEAIVRDGRSFGPHLSFEVHALRTMVC